MNKNTKAWLALIFICIVWGTTYLAIRIGVMHYPAFLFAGIRQLSAGIILMLAAYAVNRKLDWNREHILRNALIGGLMITMGNGLVTWGERYIPSGVAALICSMMPIFAVLFNLAQSRRDHFNGTILSGMILGTVGVGLIFKDSIKDFTNTVYIAGMMATLVATSSWALGSLISKRNTKQTNPMFNSGMQLFWGGVFLFVFSPFIDDYHNIDYANNNALLALGYLIVFGSVLAYAAYNFALSSLPVGVVTLYAYVNPLVAVVMGYLLLKEPLDIYTILAFITIAIGVYLVNIGYRRQHKASIDKEAEDALSALPADS
ncbi:MAG: EamA family transporter [Bacteroidetes bacterium]|nr:EamA family transporter [Bacteroidota bacterium]